MDSATKRIVAVVVAAFVLMFAVVGALGFYYYWKTTKPAVPKADEGIVKKTTTTVEVPKAIVPVVGVISDALGGIDCGADSPCFESAAKDGCKKAQVTAFTPKVTQIRNVRGGEDGKCVIDYEVTSVTSLGTPDLMGLKMTCRLSPDEIANNTEIVSNPFQAENPGCAGSLWDKFGGAPTT